MRTYIAAIALLTWFAVSCEWYAVALEFREKGQGLLPALVHYSGFFTVLTNILCALVLTAQLLPAKSAFFRLLRLPAVMTSAQACIIGVCVVYHLMLRNLWNPVGAHALAALLLHYVVPLAYTVFWWCTIPSGSLRWTDLPVVALYPAIYGIYVFLRGEILAQYPYPFFDIGNLGYEIVLLNATVIFVALMAFAAFLIFCKQRGRARS